jgi:hypothetical protein
MGHMPIAQSAMNLSSICTSLEDAIAIPSMSMKLIPNTDLGRTQYKLLYCEKYEGKYQINA